MNHRGPLQKPWRSGAAEPAGHLHVPQAPARPGESPDFSYLSLDPAGAIDRFPVDIAARDTTNTSRHLVRVLDDEGAAVGPWAPALQRAELLQGLWYMRLTRLMDERLLKAQRQGKITFYVPSTGEEAVAVGQAMALLPGDMLFPSYRNQGMHLARGRSAVELMCQCLSNSRDMCKGRQLPVMYHWREGNIFSVSGNLATQLPQAVGWAMAANIKGESHIAAAWTGEGATAEADFHHALTFAAVYQAPVILNVVNNQWAISSSQGLAGGESATFAARGPGYGVAGLRVDGNDLLALYAVTQWAAERARRGFGPTLIESVTYRAGPHSSSDDPTRYRPREEAASFPLGDPIERLSRHLAHSFGWTAAEDAQQQSRAVAEIEQCWQEALRAGALSDGPRPDPQSLFDDVFASTTAQLERQRRLLAQLSPPAGTSS